MPAASFAHVLDRLIDAGPRPSSTATTAGICTSPLLSLAFDFGASCGLRGTGARARRPRRSLTPSQETALGTLRRAGAPLADDFDDAELKAAFRRLARQWHPDMHPEAGLDRRTALAVQFAEVREAYEVLLKARP